MAKKSGKTRRKEGIQTKPSPAAGDYPDTLRIKPGRLIQHYLARQHDRISEEFLRLLGEFERYQLFQMESQGQKLIDALVGNLFFYFTRPDYQIEAPYAEQFLILHPVITNLIALSSWRTADPILQILLRQPNNFIKILALYSARSALKIDRKLLFDIHSHYASLWYGTYFYGTGGFITRQIYENMVEHQSDLDERYVIAHPNNGTAPCFRASYIDPDSEPQLKQFINRRIQAKCSNVQIRNRPVKNRIAIITANWYPIHSVYRSLQPLVATLKGHYNLTLVHLGMNRKEIDTGLFQDVRHICFDYNRLDIRVIQENDFQAVFFPDAGLEPESRYLCNLRIAPIQIMGYGHPVSTFGSRIDYIIGGASVELPEEAERNYTERLVLIPGLGAHPVIPTQKVEGIEKGTNPLIINCCWTDQKINYPLLSLLNRIIQGSKIPVRFRFFPGWLMLQKNYYLPLRKDIEAMLGEEHVEVVPALQYKQYLRILAEGTLALDSYPFGEYNSVIDSIHQGIPIITLQGKRFQNRASSQLLRQMGLEELIAYNADEYVEKCLQMIHHSEYRQGIIRKMSELDLAHLLWNTENCEAFRRAIDFLIENHERLQRDTDRSPIWIT